MAQDIRVRGIQAESIESVKPDALPIQVDVELRYEPTVPIADDYTLVPKIYVDGLVGAGNIYFTDNSVAGIDVDLSAGTIELLDIPTDFPAISGNGIIRGNFDLLISGTWYASDVLPEVTKDISGNLLTALFTTGNTGITSIRGRIN